jgi:hypothetical protein
VHGVTNLGGDHHFIALRKVLQCAANNLLAGTLRVQLRSVEEVDAQIDGVLDEGATIFLAKGPDRMATV